MVQFWGASWFLKLYFLLSQNIDGYRQNDSQDLYFLVLHITVVIPLDQGAKCSLLLCIFFTPTDKNLAKFPSRIHLRVALVFATLAAEPTRNAKEEEVVAAHEGCPEEETGDRHPVVTFKDVWVSIMPRPPHVFDPHDVIWDI